MFSVAGMIAIGLGICGILVIIGALAFIVCQTWVWVRSEEAMDSDRNWQ